MSGSVPKSVLRKHRRMDNHGGETFNCAASCPHALHGELSIARFCVAGKRCFTARSEYLARDAEDAESNSWTRGPCRAEIVEFFFNSSIDFIAPHETFLKRVALGVLCVLSSVLRAGG